MFLDIIKRNSMGIKLSAIIPISIGIFLVSSSIEVISVFLLNFLFSFIYKIEVNRF